MVASCVLADPFCLDRPTKDTCGKVSNEPCFEEARTLNPWFAEQRAAGA